MQVAAAFIMLIQGQHRVKYLKLFYCCNNGANNLKCLYEMVGWGGGGGSLRTTAFVWTSLIMEEIKQFANIANNANITLKLQESQSN